MLNFRWTVEIQFQTSCQMTEAIHLSKKPLHQKK